MDNYRDLLNNYVGGNSSSTMLQQKNSMINSMYERGQLARRNPQAIMTNVMQQGFQSSLQIQKETKDLIQVGIQRQELIGQTHTQLLTTIKNLLEKQPISLIRQSPQDLLGKREETIKDNSRLNENTKSILDMNKGLSSTLKGGFKLLSDGLLSLKQNMSLETMIALAIMALQTFMNRDGKNYFKDVSSFYTTGKNMLTLLKSGGLSTFNLLKEGGIKSFSLLKDSGTKAFNLLKDIGTKLKEGALSKISTFSTKGATSITNLTTKGLNYLSSLKSGALNIMTGLKEGALKIFNPIKNLAQTAFASLKSGIGKTVDFMMDIGKVVFDLISKIPGMSTALKGAKFLGKASGVITAGFAMYDGYVGYNNSAEITGNKNANTVQKLGAGAINSGTGFVNSLSDAANFVSGGYVNLGQINSAGVYDAITGGNRQYNDLNLIQNPLKEGVSSKGLKLAQVAENRLKGQFKANSGCYAGVAKSISIAKDKGLLTSISEKNTGSAYMFSDHVINGKASKYMHRILPNSFGDLRAGDIAVYMPKIRTTPAGKKHGHIEIIGADGSAYSDFEDRNASDLKRNWKHLKDGNLMIFRYNDSESPMLSETIGNSKKNQILSNSSNNFYSNNVTPISNVSGTSTELINKAFSGIVINEGSKNNPTKLTKDNTGYNFGLSQFNSDKNPNAWKKLGFSDNEIKSINIGNFNRSSVQNRLNNNKQLISKLDEGQKNDLASYVKLFFNTAGLDISDPSVFAQLMDIANQFGKVFDNETVGTLKKFSKGNKVTLNAIKSWRMGTLQGIKDPNDQTRRFNNINTVMKGTTQPIYGNNSLGINPSAINSYNQNGFSPNVSISSLSGVSGVDLKTIGITKSNNNVNIKLSLVLDGNFHKTIAKEIVEKKQKIQKEKEIINSKGSNFGNTKNGIVKKLSDGSSAIVLQQNKKDFKLDNNFDLPDLKLPELYPNLNYNNPFGYIGNNSSSTSNVIQKITNKNNSNSNTKISSLVSNVLSRGSNVASNINPNSVSSLIGGVLNLSSGLGGDKEVIKNLSTINNTFPNIINNSSNLIKGLDKNSYSGIVTSSGNLVSGGLKIASALGIDTNIDPNLANAGKFLVNNANKTENTISSVMSAISNPTDLSKVLKAGSNVVDILPTLGNIGDNLYKGIFGEKKPEVNSALKEVAEEVLYSEKKQANTPQQSQSSNVITIPSQNVQKPQLDMSLGIEDFPMMAFLSGVFD